MRESEKLADNILGYIVKEFQDRYLLDVSTFNEEFGHKSWDEVVSNIEDCYFSWLKRQK